MDLLINATTHYRIVCILVKENHGIEKKEILR
jgi:hypothetical protein